MTRELRAKRAKLVEEIRAVIEQCEKEERGLSAEEKEKVEKLEKEIEQIDELIKKREELKAKEQVKEETRAAISDAVRAFRHYLRTGEAPGETRDLKVSNAGGYFVPTELLKTYYEALTESAFMRQICRVIQTNSTTNIPVVSSHGTPSWVAETETATEADPTISQVTLGAYKLAYILKVSEELLNDSAINIEQFVLKEFGRIFGLAENDAFVNGDGNNKPTGIVHSAPVGKTAAAQNAITADEVIDLYYSLETPYRENAVFVANPATVAAIRKLKDSTGQYLWQPGLATGEPDKLLGRPIYTSSAVDTIGAGKKVLVIFDPNYYVIADRGGLSIAVLKERYADTGQVGYRGTLRVDGKLVIDAAAKALQMASL